MLLVTACLAPSGCALLRPAVDVVDAACTLGLLDHPMVQWSAAERGIPVAELAALLCGIPAVYEAWEDALERRRDPAAAAVQTASERGLL